MKKFGLGPSILAILCGAAALTMTNLACSSSSSSSSSTPGDAGGGGGAGGKSATGGTGVIGGSAGTGGTSPTGGDAGPTLSYTFDTSIEGFEINTYHDTTSTNLGYALAPDAGVDASSPPTLTWDMTDGSPATPPGCLKLIATYTGYGQYVDVKLALPSTNLKGHQLSVQVQLASATGGTFPGGAILEADTGSTFMYGGSQGVSLPVGTWVPLTLDLDAITTTGYDDTMVVQVGVQFYSGSAPVGAGTTFDPIEATFLLDTIEAL
jgi:hypothetical protein